MTDIEGFTLTPHAVERALDMALDPEEIRLCLTHPEYIRPSVKYPGRLNYRRGRITCGIEDRSKRVITIVWSDPQGWEADLLGVGPYAGRAYRGD